MGERVRAGEHSLACLQEAVTAREGGGLRACASHTPAVGFITSSLLGEREQRGRLWLAWGKGVWSSSGPESLGDPRRVVRAAQHVHLT